MREREYKKGRDGDREIGFDGKESYRAGKERNREAERVREKRRKWEREIKKKVEWEKG